MNSLKTILEEFKNDEYSVSATKSKELLFTHNVDPEINLKKLSKITTLRNIDKAIKYFKIGLYLSVFEDLNATIFFKEARNIFESINTSESEQFLNYINSESIEFDIYLQGTNHQNYKSTFDNFRKSRSLDEIIENFNTIRDEILYTNYLSGKSIRRVSKIIEEESIRQFKSNLNDYKVQYNILENQKRNEIINLKEELRAERKKNLKDKIRAYLKDNKLEVFTKFANINRKTILEKKSAITANYKNVLVSLESQKKATVPMSAITKKVLLQTIEKCNTKLKEITEIENTYNSYLNIEEINYDRELIKRKNEIDDIYEGKHNKLKDEFRGMLDYKRIFFESIRTTQNATLFGKDFLRIFSMKGDNYSASDMWNAFLNINIIEQDYEDFPIIRNTINSMKKKANFIVKKSLEIFEHPDQIYIEIEKIENNIN